jgi:allantoinase
MKTHLFDLAITGNILFEGQLVGRRTLLIDKGRVSGIIDSAIQVEAKQHLHAEGKWVLPGVVDEHVHSLSYPGEGFYNSTRSAAAGGVTTIIDMPVDAPGGTATPETLKKKIALVEQESFTDVALTGVVKNETIHHIHALKEEGVCGFKLSLFHTEANRFPRIDDGHLFEAFSVIRETGLTAGVHAENDELINFLIEKHVREGKTYPRAHCETRPEVSETESVLKALEFARATGVRLHLYHISCSRSIEFAAHFKEEGCLVTSETCPHYLFFSEEDMERFGGLVRINPPVRKEGEQDRLWRLLSKRQIDCVGSDHIPWPEEWKRRPTIFECASGIPGVETLLPLLFSEGVLKGQISMVTLSKILSENPAKIFKLYPRKGILSIGSDADMVIFDPEKKWVLRGEQMHTTAKWTPCEGMEVTGGVETTIVRGMIVYHQGNIVGEKGYGAFIRPNLL